MAQAADVTWVGTQDTAWANGANWDNGIGPDSGDVAFINSGNVDFNEEATRNLRALRLLGGTLTFSGGYFRSTFQSAWDSHVEGTVFHAGTEVEINELEVGRTLGNSLFNFNWFSIVQQQPQEAPDGLTSTPLSVSQIDLSWDTAEGATSYTIKRSNLSGDPYTTIASGVTGTSYTDTGLTAGTPYFYVISASSGNGASENTEQVISIPSAPIPPDQIFAPLVGIEGGQFEVIMQNSGVGWIYQLETSPDLEAEWQEFDFPQLGDGTDIVLSAPVTAGQSKQFFRVRVFRL